MSDIRCRFREQPGRAKRHSNGELRVYASVVFGCAACAVRAGVCLRGDARTGAGEPRRTQGQGKLYLLCLSLHGANLASIRIPAI